MNFRILILTFLIGIAISGDIFGFPERTELELKRQDELTAQINTNPNDPHLRFELAMEYAATGWIELAWDQLKLVPKLSEEYQDIVYEKYSAIVLKKPNDWQAHFRLAFAYYFKKVLDINPKHIWSMGFIALIYGEQKEYERCIKWCKKALKINNDATAIHFLVGKAYYETGNYFGVLGETLSVARLKSIEAKYRPIPPIGITE